MAAGEYGHQFYLPYLRAAKCAHEDAVFEIAEENYIKALDCLGRHQTQDEQYLNVLDSVYTNYASCLTMMHRYEEAQDMLKRAEALPVEVSGKESVYAILYAALGRQDGVRENLDRLLEKNRKMAEYTKQMTDEILEGDHAHFAAVPARKELMPGFWQWFSENDQWLQHQFQGEKYDDMLNALSEKLTPIFPFMERDLEFGITTEQDQYVVELGDFFSVSLTEGYKELLEMQPENLRDHWSFRIVH